MAIEMLVRRWQTPLLRFATVMTGKQDLAQEAVQDAWIALIRGITHLKDPVRYKSWMFRIVRNKCIDVIRQSQRHSGNASPEPSGRKHLDQLEHRDQIKSTLLKLSEEHRIVLALHYLYQMNVTEVAETLSVPIGTVKSRLFNARKAFRLACDSGENTNEPVGSENFPGTTSGVVIN